jgi:hypothetical protein
MVRIRDQRWLGIWDVNALAIEKIQTQILLIEIPMQYYYYGCYKIRIKSKALYAIKISPLFTTPILKLISLYIFKTRDINHFL